MARIHRKLYKKDLHDPDNHYGVITHLEPDILEWEVKWVLGSITTNNATGGDVIPVELFEILEDDAVKVLHSAEVQPGVQEYPRDEWRQWGRRQTHTEGCVEEVDFFIIRIAQFL